MILHEGRPTSTIAVGDPLTFRLEAQDGYNYVTDIFATNVIARDPYTGRSVTLIDRYGCVALLIGLEISKTFAQYLQSLFLMFVDARLTILYSQHWIDLEREMV